MAIKNELTVIDTSKTPIIPSSEDMTAVIEELKDIERIPYGRIRIAGAGAGVFRVTEPGDENSSAATEVVGVIIFSHRCNVKWATAYGDKSDGPKTPECLSMDGVNGVIAETGEMRTCDTCQFNQFGSGYNARSKACRNSRRLYIMREGDVFPIIMSLPATSLKAFDYYRTRLAVKRKVPASVVTRFTLKSMPGADKNQEYTVAEFEATGALPKEEVARVRAYAAQFAEAAKNVGLEDESEPESYTPSRPAPVNARNGEFVEIEPDEDDPFAEPVGSPPPTHNGF